MYKPRILILGAGERVKLDLLPVLVALGYGGSDLLILRKSAEQLSDFPQFVCIKMDEVVLGCFNPEIVISCLPTSDTVDVIQKVLKFTSPKNLFVDTPIAKIYKDLTRMYVPEGIHVLEDNHLVFFSSQLLNSRGNSHILIVWKAFYDYHGIALLSRTFGETSKLFFKIRLRNFLFLLFRAGRTFVIWIGPRNYSNGKLFFVKPAVKKHFLQEYKLDLKFVSDWAKNYILDNLDPVYVDKVLTSNPVRNMLFWKRMALGENLGKFLFDGENNFLKLENAIQNERYFRRFRQIF